MDTNKRFIALDLAVDAAASVLRLLDQLPKRHSDLAGQGRRAVVSGPLLPQAQVTSGDRYLGEGAARVGRDRLYHYRVALGSLKEAKAAVELVVRLTLVDGEAGRESLGLLDRACAATWRLVQATAR